MLPLYEMLMNADNGRAFDLMARQYHLSRQQVELAVEALTPAFSQGLKRNASDPYGVGAFLQAMSSGQHAKYFEDAAKAFQPAGVDEGNGILGHLFGSKELSRAIAAQAAQATGIGQEIFKQMLPALASMIMGGLFKQSTGQMGGATSGNPLIEMMNQMMRQGAGGGQGAGMDSPLGRMMEGMFGGARQASHNPYGEFGKMFEQMFAGKAATPEPPANPSGRPRTPYDDLFGDMFEAGAKTRNDHHKNMESIFDQFLKGMEKGH